MNIKSYSGVVAGVVASTTVLVAPAQAASVQVRELEVRPGDGKLELALSLAPESANLSGEKPQVSTTQKDRVLIAEIANARLDLGNGQDIFTQDNPLPGIERIEVMESAPGNVKIVALGEVTAPEGEILSQDNNSILLNVTSAAPTEVAQATPGAETVFTPPMLAQSAPSNNNQNNFLQPTAPIPPFLPRASAPPVGDISVSTTDTSLPRYVNLQTNAIVPRLVLKQAPAEDVMALLARTAGINLVVSGDISDRSVSLDIENEPVQKVFDYVLMLSDLKAVMKDRTVFIGKDLPSAVIPRITRTLRLNQANVFQAQCYLETGSDSVEEEGDGLFTCANEIEEETEATDTTNIGFRRLRDLFVNELETTLDTRLNAITLTGEPKVVEMATNLLTQLDARKRQVAVNVKILDVTLSGNRSISSDIKLLLEDRVGISAGDGIILSPNDLSRASDIFSEFNPNGIVIEQGNQQVSFGEEFEVFDSLDPANTVFVGSITEAYQIAFPGSPLPAGLNEDQVAAVIRTLDDAGNVTLSIQGLGANVSDRAVGRGTNFIGSLVAGLLRNTTSKIIADPTLIVQENQIANIDLTEDIVVGTVERRQQNDQGNITDRIVEPVIDQVGLKVAVGIERIDDNGFITLNVQPEVSSVAGQEIVNDEPVTLKRQTLLQSGSVRLRDDQTLLLAGVIDERDLVTTAKVPILGDIPLIGSLFRSTSRDNSRRELLFIITPQIIDDSQNAMWGYGYQPSETAREMLDNTRFPTR
ncbi:hypothetical protein AWQ21_02760 [Picosynechococcus sp. PCC 7003]|uniref:AMIN domain-containing protein n=1 Tax=Picosynechococcus sp. PCC 7003 TaxID=374981 RepID=UPI0008103511|nr:AMIN domain-containing protein [Picosynechococcus sp. PCC 7003]ANV83392.1 hypothetical protein AWQ21_02760 [Picosynechococcus sp. PCC 7003]